MNPELQEHLRARQLHFTQNEGNSPEEAVKKAEAEFIQQYGITLIDADKLYKSSPAQKKWREQRKNHPLLTQGVRFDAVGDGDDRIIEGFLSVEIEDRQGTIISTKAIMESFDEYKRLSKMKLRVQHQPVPVGRVLKVEERQKKMDDGKLYDGVWIQAEISKGFDAADDTWAMIKAKALEGFSIGFDSVAETVICPKQQACIPRIVKLHWIETSVVDLPANPGAFIDSIRSYYRTYTDILNSSRENMADKTGQRQEPPPAAPPAEAPPEAPPAEEQPLDKIMKQLDGIESAIADLSKRVSKLEGGEEEPPAEEAPPEAPPAEGASVDERGTEGVTEGTPEKQLEVAHARIKALETDLAKKGEDTEPRSGAPGSPPKAGPLGIDIPEDMRNMSPRDVEYIYQAQKAAARKHGM